MTVPHRTYTELIGLLKEAGWEVVSDRDWETHNRVMIGKGGHSFPLQIKDTYWYHEIVKMFESLGITPPQDCSDFYTPIRKEREKAKAAKSREQEPGEE